MLVLETTYKPCNIHRGIGFGTALMSAGQQLTAVQGLSIGCHAEGMTLAHAVDDENAYTYALLFKR